ncbi:GRRM system radical SAM/SPASM domain protein [Solwaraspora sp. WMMD406]|uniref:cyclophane-forming radical SAM/SPASM peptide maturase GrrM/OscB n=1 Tax=Solwaraspora sp. WMMD406 TaxID=3016095 RepID=UPI0024171B46|nr:cyclophane-forming radical SAM/SPASM peptide maturase GrrM/OscB [Solwaraspora sp. WMMD406]MDG4765654.1 GRRM system radical SAM/SPASM domain protein [Solwaraspora sp. WMMD406]
MPRPPNNPALGPDIAPAHAPRLGPVRQVVLQATGYCNINCGYCYLPDRERRTLMPLDVVEATAHTLTGSGILAEQVEVRWHAGEPLTAPRDFYRQANEILRRELGPYTRVGFSLQTNGLLIDDAWCALLRDEQIRVGVSIDGPAVIHDVHRRTRQGRGTHARAHRGAGRLHAAGIPFDVISVVTPQTLRHQDLWLDYLAELRPRSIGLNPEETEGGNTSTLHRLADFDAAYRAFLRRVATWSAETGIRVRELAAMRTHIVSHQLPIGNTQSEPLAIVTVGANGDVGSFSPELLGWRAADHGDFVLGNVTEPGFALDRWRPGFARLAAQVEQGRRACARTCGYFALCGGGAPANKWAENSDFTSTRTRFCTLGVLAVADTVLEQLDPADDPDAADEFAAAGESSAA